MLGGHLDSWHAATGATDNAIGCAVMMEAARILAESKRVVIVDTSNEIGGDGDVPHPAVGKARRMQVREPMLQHEVMIEAVENQ